MGLDWEFHMGSYRDNSLGPQAGEERAGLKLRIRLLELRGGGWSPGDTGP